MCHASPDKEFVRPFADLLARWGHDVWLDERRLLAGQDWKHEIETAVQETDTVIVVLSKRSVNKTGFVQKEVRLALDAADERPEGSIFLIPFRLDDSSVPSRLASRHWLDASRDDAYERLHLALEAATDHLAFPAVTLDSRVRNGSTDLLSRREGPAAVSEEIFDVLKREIEQSAPKARRRLRLTAVAPTTFGFAAPQELRHDRWRQRKGAGRALRLGAKESPKLGPRRLAVQISRDLSTANKTRRTRRTSFTS